MVSCWGDLHIRRAAASARAWPVPVSGMVASWRRAAFRPCGVRMNTGPSRPACAAPGPCRAGWWQNPAQTRQAAAIDPQHRFARRFSIRPGIVAQTGLAGLGFSSCPRQRPHGAHGAQSGRAAPARASPGHLRLWALRFFCVAQSGIRPLLRASARRSLSRRTALPRSRSPASCPRCRRGKYGRPPRGTP